MKQNAARLEFEGVTKRIVGQAVGVVGGRDKGMERYRNQYQTASKRYVLIDTDTNKTSSELCQNGPKMEVSGAIPTLASIVKV